MRHAPFFCWLYLFRKALNGRSSTSLATSTNPLAFSNCVHEHECTCSGTLIARYQKRLSGPLLDRIDIHVEVPRVPFQKLSDDRRGESSAAIRGRVEAARGRQTARFAGTKLICKADMGPTQIKDYRHIDDAARSLLGAAMRQTQLSARAYHRILKLGRTITDLCGEERIGTAHIAEAIEYRAGRQG